MTYELREGQYLVSTDPSLLDMEGIHAFLTDSYWAEGVPLEVVARSVEHSLPFGLYDGRAQIGFARVITDFATYAYLADVYVEAEYQGQGLALLAGGDGPPDSARAAGSRHGDDGSTASSGSPS
jgi:GNAT superfamily N-acetyltransferase